MSWHAQYVGLDGVGSIKSLESPRMCSEVQAMNIVWYFLFESVLGGGYVRYDCLLGEVDRTVRPYYVLLPNVFATRHTPWCLVKRYHTYSGVIFNR
jgi:hypothetical protein